MLFLTPVKFLLKELHEQQRSFGREKDKKRNFLTDSSGLLLLLLLLLLIAVI